MKSLSIKSDNCTLSKSDYSVTIDGTEIADLIKKNLPEDLKNYKDYLVRVNIQIEFLELKELRISTEGYEVKKGESEENVDEWVKRTEYNEYTSKVAKV